MNLSASLKRRAATGALLLMGALAVFGLCYKAYFVGGESFEFCHYAELASNLLKGRGLATSVYYPGELAYLERAGAHVGRTGPVVGRFPLPAYWAAFWMGLAGVDDFGRALANGAALALWTVSIYVLGCALFSETAGLAAAALWALNPVAQVGYVLYGYPDVLFGALFCLLNALYWPRVVSEGAEGAKAFLGLGALAALTFLARQSFVIWLPFYLGAPVLLGPRRRWRQAGLFLGGFVLVSLPSAVYYWRHLGLMSPPLFIWNLAEGTLVPLLPWMEYRTFAFADFASAEVLGRLAAKWFSCLNLFLKDAPSFWQQAIALPFAAAGMLGAEGGAAGLAPWLLVLLGWQVFVFSFLRYESLGFMAGRYYAWLGPFLLLYAADFLIKRRSSRRWRLVGWAVLFLLLQGWLRSYALVPTKSDYPGGLNVADWPEFVYLREATAPSARIATNIPTQVGWYAERPAISLPNRHEDLAKIEARWRVDYLYLSSSRVGELPNFPAWRSLIQGGVPAVEKLGFKLEKSFPGGALFKR